MKKRTVVQVMVVAMLSMAASCQTTTQQDLMGSGVALKAVGEQWLAVNDAFVKGCVPAAPKLPKEQCDKARDFGEKFKKSYPLAMQIYETAVNAKDASMASDSKSIVRGLSADLVKFGLQVGIALQEVK